MFGDQGLVAIKILHTKNTCCWFSTAHCWSKTWSIENTQYFFPLSRHFGSPWSWIFKSILLNRSVYFIQSKMMESRDQKRIQSIHLNSQLQFHKKEKDRSPFWVYTSLPGSSGGNVRPLHNANGTVLGAVHQLLLTESHQITTCQLPRLRWPMAGHPCHRGAVAMSCELDPGNFASSNVIKGTGVLVFT